MCLSFGLCYVVTWSPWNAHLLTSNRAGNFHIYSWRRQDCWIEYAKNLILAAVDAIFAYHRRILNTCLVFSVISLPYQLNWTKTLNISIWREDNRTRHLSVHQYSPRRQRGHAKWMDTFCPLLKPMHNDASCISRFEGYVSFKRRHSDGAH